MFWFDFIHIIFLLVCLVASITFEIKIAKSLKSNNVGKVVSMLRASLIVNILLVAEVAVFLIVVLLLKFSGFALVTWMSSILEIWPIVLIGGIIAFALSIKALTIGAGCLKDSEMMQ